MSWQPDKWDLRFLDLADTVGQWSKDTTKVGAVIVDPECRIVSLGFNGLPRGMTDDPARLLDRDFKWHTTVHAERNALLFARQSLVGCTIYTTPCQPCSQCASMIVQAGIRKVVCRGGLRYDAPFIFTPTVLKEAGISFHFVQMC